MHFVQLPLYYRSIIYESFWKITVKDGVHVILASPLNSYISGYKYITRRNNEKEGSSSTHNVSFQA